MTKLRVMTLVIFSCGTMVWGASWPEPEVLSVCAGLKEIERLNGKIVTIHGVVAWVGRHGVKAMSQDGLDPTRKNVPVLTDESGLGRPR